MHLHRWGKWKDPIVVGLSRDTFLIQKRTCSVCNKVKVRRFTV